MKNVIIILSLLLVGCAQSPKQISEPSLPPTKKMVHEEKGEQTQHHHHPQHHQYPQHHRKQHQGKQQKIAKQWVATGRLAVSQAQKGGNASFVWEQRGEAYQIKLFGPFGAGAVQIQGRPYGVEVREGNGKITRAQTPELALRKIVGWQVPLTGLQYWLRGMPAPTGAVSSQQFDQRGLLTHLAQHGWQIDYESYLPNRVQPTPNKLRLQNGDLRIKMIVTSWQYL